MQENKLDSFISFCYIDKNPEIRLINYNDAETYVIKDERDEQ